MRMQAGCILAESNPQGINKEHHFVKTSHFKGCTVPIWGGKVSPKCSSGNVTGKVWFRIAFHIRKGIAQWIHPPQAELPTIKNRWLLIRKAWPQQQLQVCILFMLIGGQMSNQESLTNGPTRARRADRHRFHSHHRTAQAALLLTASTKPFPVMQKMPRQDGVFHGCRS